MGNNSSANQHNQNTNLSNTEGGNTEEDGLVKPLFENGRYKNPFDTFEERHLSDVFKMIRSKDNSSIPWGNKQVSGLVVVFFISAIKRFCCFCKHVSAQVGSTELYNSVLGPRLKQI